VGGIARLTDGSIDYGKDFFGQKAYLTVSGQIQGEYYACALSNIYTFGPTFRAENSHTSRHLAEFWMIEPEMAFCDLTDDMQCAEDYVRFCCQSILKTCRYQSPSPALFRVRVGSPSHDSCSEYLGANAVHRGLRLLLLSKHPQNLQVLFALTRIFRVSFPNHNSCPEYRTIHPLISGGGRSRS
jgi:hypothetical protein